MAEMVAVVTAEVVLMVESAVVTREVVLMVQVKATAIRVAKAKAMAAEKAVEVMVKAAMAVAMVKVAVAEVTVAVATVLAAVATVMAAAGLSSAYTNSAEACCLGIHIPQA